MARQFGNYRVLQAIGEGTWCQVKWVEDEAGNGFAAKRFSKEQLGQPVARFSAVSSGSITLAERIQEELNILRGLSHRNIVALHEVIEDEQGTMHVVLEGMRGGQLMHWDEKSAAYRVRGGAMELGDGEGLVCTVEMAKHVMMHVLEGAAYLHEHGVIHKDLKPDNILLSTPLPAEDPRFARHVCRSSWPEVCFRERTSDGGAPLAETLERAGFTAKIADFNTAMVAEPPDCPIYDALGTLLFTPPECFKAQLFAEEEERKCTPGKPRDAWSLGCVLFVMLFGRCPFWVDGPNIFLQLQIMDEELVVPEEVSTREAAELIHALMAREVDQRMLPAAALEHPWLRDGE